MEIKKILLTDKFTQEALLTLQNQSYLKVEKTPFPDLRNTDLTDVSALIIRSRTIIDEEILKRAKKLQVVITATSGFDHIDLSAATKWGVTVMFTPQANILSAAQLTWGLVLNCAQKISLSQKMVKSGEWNRELVTGVELAHKTYGIVGLGRIGMKVAEMAQAFGMNVIAFDPYAPDSHFREALAERVSYEEVLKRSDVLSFHVPKTSETEKMLTRSQFEFINRQMILINTSRGSVIDEKDLVEALQKNQLLAVGLDVFEKEPLPRQSGLLQFQNVVLTPHCGANTTEAFAKASEQAALKLIHFFQDSTTSDTLPPKAAWYGAVSPWKKQDHAAT
jgi:D-3-phosphoglycerate dehydrogenase